MLCRVVGDAGRVFCASDRILEKDLTGLGCNPIPIVAINTKGQIGQSRPTGRLPHFNCRAPAGQIIGLNRNVSVVMLPADPRPGRNLQLLILLPNNYFRVEGRRRLAQHAEIPLGGVSHVVVEIIAKDDC